MFRIVASSFTADAAHRMSKVCVAWSLEDLLDMSEEDMNVLLESYEPDVVPSLEQVRLGEEPGVWQFDGSFGWAI